MHARPVCRWIALAALIVGASGCRRARPEPSPAASATAPRPPVAAPAELLAEGALRGPSEAWPRLRALVGGPALRLPSTFPLAVTTLIGASPLVAGLIDDRAAVALAFVDDGGEPSAVVGVHLTSGAELVVALANGSAARFASEVDGARGLTTLTLGRGGGGLAIGVVGDTLVLARSRAALLLAAEYVARTLAPSIGEGETLTLVARKAALAGRLATAVRDRARAAIQDLEAADRASRLEHGRLPDFGDPVAVLGALSSLTDAVTAVLSSVSLVRASASLVGPLAELSVEVVPEAIGAASELVRDLPIGDASPLLELPPTTDVALLVHRGTSSGEGAATRGFAALFGERLRGGDRTRLTAWLADVDEGVGTPALVGVTAGSEGPAAFLVAPRGNGVALRRAVSAVPMLLQIPALSGPMKEFVGPLTARPASRAIPGLGSTTELHLRRASARSGGMDASVAIVVASAETRVMVTAGAESSSGRFAELLGGASAGIGGDPVVARAMARAGSRVGGAALARFRDAAARSGWAALSVGSDRRVGWIDVTASDVALGAWLASAQSR